MRECKEFLSYSPGGSVYHNARVCICCLLIRHIHGREKSGGGGGGLEPMLHREILKISWNIWGQGLKREIRY